MNDYGAHHLALAVVVRRDLVLLGQVHLVALFVEQQHLFLPYLIQFAGYDLTDHVGVLEVEVFLLQLEDLRCERLAQVKNHTATEGLHLHFVGEVLAYLDLGVSLTCLAERDLVLRIGYVVVFHHETVAVDLEVTLVGVDDHVVVSVRTVHLGDHVTEGILQHVDEGLFVNSLEVLELREDVNQIDCVLVFN